VKILFLNQMFYPETAAVAQHLTDLAQALSARGHTVTVIAGRSGYNDPTIQYAAKERLAQIDIRRVSSGRFPKNNLVGRIAGAFLFFFNVTLGAMFAGRQDVVVGMTNPPLISVVAALFCIVRGGRFVYWVMDLNPDEAIAAGVLRQRSIAAWVLEQVSRFTLRTASKIIALDAFMAERVARKIGSSSTIEVVSPWSPHGHIRPIAHAENQFRNEHRLQKKFVVMYSGNHSLCHPLDTMLQAALALSEDPSVVFVFIGDGVRARDVAVFRSLHGLTNIVQLPYQVIDKIAYSLSAADLHVVTMGDRYVGIVHPSKIYGILAVGRPFIYVGPRASAIAALVRETGLGLCVDHGDVDSFVNGVKRFRDQPIVESSELSARMTAYGKDHFGAEVILPRFVNLLEEVGAHG